MNHPNGKSYCLPATTQVGPVGENQMNDTLKRCATCGQYYPRSREFFYADSRASDGLYSHCKECHREYDKRHYRNNREKILAEEKAYFKAHPGLKSATRRRYYERHREKILRRGRDRARKNLEYERERVKRYRAEHPEVYTASTHRRLARKRKLPNTLTTQEWEHALSYFDGCCAVCERPLNGLFHTAAADHWIPLSNPNCPGTIPTNVVPLCHGMDGCNNSKHDRDPEEWLVEKFGKRRAHQILSRIQVYFASLES